MRNNIVVLLFTMIALKSAVYGIECKTDGLVKTFLDVATQEQDVNVTNNLYAKVECGGLDSKLGVGAKIIPNDANISGSNPVEYLSVSLSHQEFYTNYANWIDITNKPTTVIDVASEFRTKSVIWSVNYSKNTEQSGSNNNKYADLLLRIMPPKFDFLGSTVAFGYRQFHFKTTATIRDVGNYVAGYDGVWRALRQSESIDLSTTMKQYFLEVPTSGIDKLKLAYEQDTVPFAATYMGELNNKVGELYTQARRTRYGLMYGYDKKHEELTERWGLKSYMVGVYVAQMKATQNYEVKVQWAKGPVTKWWTEISYQFEPYINIRNFGKDGKFFISLPIETFAIPITEKRFNLRDIYVNEMIWAIKANFSYRF